MLGPGEGEAGTPVEELHGGRVPKHKEERLCRVLEEEHSRQGSSSAKGLRQDRVKVLEFTVSRRKGWGTLAQAPKTAKELVPHPWLIRKPSQDLWLGRDMIGSAGETISGLPDISCGASGVPSGAGSGSRC